MDWATLDRLLADGLHPGDAPPGYEAMARLVAAATPPVAADELAGEQAAVAQFGAMTRVHPPTPTRSRPTPPSRLVRGKAAAPLVVADRPAPTLSSGPTLP